jgi:hypothetical protein
MEDCTMKSAIIVLSDPNNGEDALGRVFNALATAYDYQQAGDDVTILFQGAGTRWIGELSQSNHPVHALFDAVKDNIAGVSCGCAEVFGATEAAEKAGFDFLKDNAVPGTAGLPSLRTLAMEGYNVATF